MTQASWTRLAWCGMRLEGVSRGDSRSRCLELSWQGQAGQGRNGRPMSGWGLGVVPWLLDSGFILFLLRMLTILLHINGQLILICIERSHFLNRGLS